MFLCNINKFEGVSEDEEALDAAALDHFLSQFEDDSMFEFQEDNTEEEDTEEDNTEEDNTEEDNTEDMFQDYDPPHDVQWLCAHPESAETAEWIDRMEHEFEGD